MSPSKRKILLLLFTFCCFLIVCTEAARWSKNKSQFDKMKKNKDKKKRPGRIHKNKKILKDLMELSGGEDIEELYSLTTGTADTVTKYRQTYCGFPVYDSMLTVKEDKMTKKAKRVSGKLLRDLGKQLNCDKIKVRITPDKAEQIVKRYLKRSNKAYRPKHITFKFRTDPYVDLNKKNFRKATLMYKVYSSVHNISGSFPSYVTKVDSFRREVVDHWEDKQYFNLTGTGGNSRHVNKYGSSLPQVEVKKYSNGVCELRDDRFWIIDANQNDWWYDKPYAFYCNQGVGGAINGAYAPLLDVYFFTKQVFAMFDKYVKEPLFTKPPMPAKIIVHFQRNYVNAFYSSSHGIVAFGDGDGQSFHPLTSQAIVAHEMVHRYTFENTNLEYTNIAGGLNEAISDIAGTAADHFTYNTSFNFLSGDLIVTGQSIQFMRNMCRQSDDKISIIHTSQYKDGLDPHHVSGVFNYVACCLHKLSNWDIEKVFKMFILAKYYLTPTVNSFSDAACALASSADDAQFDLPQLKTCFTEVGMYLDTTCQGQLQSGTW